MSTQRYNCTACQQMLHPAKVVSLEFDQRINEYHDFGGIPPESNQGGFPFGADCAKKAREKARVKLAKFKS